MAHLVKTNYKFSHFPTTEKNNSAAICK